MNLHKQTLAGLALAIGLAANVPAGTLENMERERASLIDTLLSPELSIEQRQQRAQTTRRRLVDLERMVLRDESLTGKDTPVVRTAFANYDLTFLVHASTEKEKLVIDHWLTQLDITTSTLMNSRMGRH
jgi:hypothetical protein